jgi:hypothetical protein
MMRRAAVGEGKYEELCDPIPVVLKQAVTCSRALQYTCQCQGLTRHAASSCVMQCWANSTAAVRPYCPVQPAVR